MRLRFLVHSLGYAHLARAVLVLLGKMYNWAVQGARELSSITMALVELATRLDTEWRLRQLTL
jgi:hypothetical protein